MADLICVKCINPETKYLIKGLCHRCYKREYDLKNREKRCNQRLDHYYKNKQRYRKINKEYKEKNRNKILSYQKVYNKKYRPIKKLMINKRYKDDTVYRLITLARNRIRKKLKKRTLSSDELLGCSGEELAIYMESKFKDGMNWDNMGLWHIDHIRPICKFELSNPEQVRMCFHYSNLQPLWGKDNLIKKRKNWRQ